VPPGSPIVGHSVRGGLTTTTTTPFTPHTASTTPAQCVARFAQPIQVYRWWPLAASLAAPSSPASPPPGSPPAAQLVPRVPPAGVVPIFPVVHPHPMRTRGADDFYQPVQYLATTLSPILKSVRATLANPHWRASMKKNTPPSSPTARGIEFRAPAELMLSPKSGSSSTV
jgi:hypothetical protein